MDEHDFKEDLLDINDLIEAANADSNTLSKEASAIDPHQVEVRDFIRTHNIEASDRYVPLELIYYHYTEKSANPLTRHKFYPIFEQYFPRKRIKGKDCCKITPNSIGLPEYYSIYRDPVFNKAAKTFSTKYRGVYSVSGYYIARIKLEDGKHYLGRFRDEKDAAVAYDIAALYHFGPLTSLNFPERIREYEKEIEKDKKEN